MANKHCASKKTKKGKTYTTCWTGAVKYKPKQQTQLRKKSKK